MSDLSEIENRAAQERRQLAASLSRLAGVASPDRLAQDVAARIEGYGGELGRQVWQAARANPVSLALVGTGLALMVAGPFTKPDASGSSDTDTAPGRAAAGFDARVEAADTAIRAGETGQSQEGASASSMRSALGRGLERLPASARRRVLRARKAALAAQERVEHQARRAAGKGRALHARQPLATGAIALGLGAIVGALFPATRREDALLGRERDALLAKAQEALSEEMARLNLVAKTQQGDTARQSHPAPDRG
ncbi:hypothetical protein KUH32_01305 [Thalassococcus sp. CAU 1522]|uniref:DUF3618 domain-containing protein n=1 Tax=Thalassococcus arenae TaxID=2851652 RepID=A0ABS6N311_9RHOB|nr:hypothetical protein [Thalassococcus arenae]MBV2358398.1 hypothetical protein [Thalassococcus arenae]